MFTMNSKYAALEETVNKRNNDGFVSKPYCMASLIQKHNKWNRIFRKYLTVKISNSLPMSLLKSLDLLL